MQGNYIVYYFYFQFNLEIPFLLDLKEIGICSLTVAGF